MVAGCHCLSSRVCAALASGAQAAHGASWGQRLFSSQCTRAAQPVGKGSLCAGQTGHTGFQSSVLPEQSSRAAGAGCFHVGAAPALCEIKVCEN